MTTALGTEEHPGRVRIVGYDVGVRQYFGYAPRSNSSQNANIAMEKSQLKDELRSELKDELTSQIEQKVRDTIKDELRHEIRREMEELP